MRRKWRGLAAVIFLVLLWSLATGAAAPGRSNAVGGYALELDGVIVGWVESVEGGHPVADVVTEKLGGDHLLRKHIGNVKYEEITLKVGAGASKAFYEWVMGTVNQKSARKNGAIIAADYNYKEVHRLTFTGGLITEVGFPALDAASKDAAKMTIKIRPETTRRVTNQAGKQLPPQGKTQKQWLPANFRLKIDGLESATSRVNKIDALVIKQKVVEQGVGEMRSAHQEPAGLEVPNLGFTLAETDAEPLYTWFDDFVINGHNGQEKEKGATLEYLAQDNKSVLFTLTFQNLGIFKLAPEKLEAGAEGIRRVKAEMYCESITFTHNDSSK